MKYTKKSFIKIKDVFGDGYHLMVKEDFINWMESILKNGHMFQIDEYSIIERKQLSDDKLAKIRDNMVNKNLVQYDLDKLEYVVDMDILFENLFDEDQEELNMMVEKVMRKQNIEPDLVDGYYSVEFKNRQLQEFLAEGEDLFCILAYEIYKESMHQMRNYLREYDD